MLNPLDFPNGKKLLIQSKKILKNIVKLKAHAKKKRVPTIYINDNYGQWKSEAQAIFERCIAEDSLGKEMAQALKPEESDYFVIKPKHSAFFSTTLSVLLEEMGAKRLIITGIATDICILFSVFDAYLRNYEIFVPIDCTASEVPSQKRNALNLMKKKFGVRTTGSKSISI